MVANFVSEYLAGRTPLPCAHCNTRAEVRGTGDSRGWRWARRPSPPGITRGWSGRRASTAAAGACCAAATRAKDQSYFLFGLTQAQLARAVFPLGGDDEGPTCGSWRASAACRSRTSDDSQEICFVPNNDYAAVVERRRPAPRGPAPSWTPAAACSGATPASTASPSASARASRSRRAGAALRARRRRAHRARVVVGTRGELERPRCTASGRELDRRQPAGRHPLRVVGADPLPPSARARARRAAAATAARASSFDEPQLAITPGQAVVFYDGDEVVGEVDGSDGK